MSPELENYLKFEWYGAVDRFNVDGSTALHHALHLSSGALLELIQLMGVLIHQPNERGMNALHFACYYREYHAAVLLASHINQHLVDASNATPLHYACLCTPSLVPILKWTEARGIRQGLIYFSGFMRILWDDDEGKTPRDILRRHPNCHIHVLAKLRRLLGTLPAAYIRLVHAFT